MTCHRFEEGTTTRHPLEDATVIHREWICGCKEIYEVDLGENPSNLDRTEYVMCSEYYKSIEV